MSIEAGSAGPSRNGSNATCPPVAVLIGGGVCFEPMSVATGLGAGRSASVAAASSALAGAAAPAAGAAFVEPSVGTGTCGGAAAGTSPGAPLESLAPVVGAGAPP